MESIPLSCYIRTFNEAKRIRPVIERVREIGAEVIVVDSGSSDGTQDIARDAGATVIEKPWPGNGFQKRNGEDAASNDWLLDLDADELLSPELQHELRQLFADGEPAPGIYAVKLVTVPVPKGVVWSNCTIAWRNKLYHKSVARMPEHAAWDQLDLPKTQPIPKLDAALLHYSFLNIEQQMAKMNRVSTVRANETRLKSKNALALRILFGFPFYLFKKLILQGMFKAGVYGFACAAVIASNRWLKDVKMYEIHLEKDGRNEL